MSSADDDRVRQARDAQSYQTVAVPDTQGFAVVSQGRVRGNEKGWQPGGRDGESEEKRS